MHRHLAAVVAAAALALTATLTAVAPAAHAAPPAYYPSGPQAGVPVATVTGGGWTECYRDTYGNYLDLATLLASCTGDHLMLAARPTGSGTLSLLAAAPRADVLLDTGNGDYTTTHQANGSEWYFNEYWSWGFAQAGSVVNKDSCDFRTSGWHRLCWHSSSTGYRIGDLVAVHDGSYERIVYHTGPNTTQTITPTAPAPAIAAVGQTYDASATGGASGNAVVLTIDPSTTGAGTNRAACTIDAAGLVTFARQGTCVVNADQAAGNGYDAAPRLQRTITVAKAAPITFTSTRAQAKVGSTYQVTATSPSPAPITFSVTSGRGGSCTIARVGPKSVPTVTFTAPGTCTVVASQDATGGYGPATATQAVAVVAS